MADLGAGATGAQNFLNFMQFFAKFGKIMLAPPPAGLAPPPTGNPGSAPGQSYQMKVQSRIKQGSKAKAKKIREQAKEINEKN